MNATGEATLYGDLIRYVRERWAREVAHDDIDLAVQTERINRLIKSWLFEPQDVILYGYTPRDYIRYEQTFGMGPAVDPALMRKVQAEHAGLVNNPGPDHAADDGPLHFSLGCRVSLLDEYDPDFAPETLTPPEGSPTLGPIPPEMAAVMQMMAMTSRYAPAADLPEASHWLKTVGDRFGFAPRRFPSTTSAGLFVDQLYRLGAASVAVDALARGRVKPRTPTFNALRVTLPHDGHGAAELYQLWVTEMTLKQGRELTPYILPGEIIFVWQ
jgi:hypothetical protein